MNERDIRTIIVDDEAIARSIIANFLLSFREINILGDFEDGKKALDFLKQHHVDLIFIDIEMPGLNGIDVLKNINPVHGLPLIIVTTAYKDYALPAFELSVFDYLLKPFDQERFTRTMHKVLKQVDLLRKIVVNKKVEHFVENYNPDFDKKTSYDQRITIKNIDKIFLVNVQDIDWISGEGDYIKLHCGLKEHLLNDSLKNILAKLDPDKFQRIHKSIIVNVDSIKEFKPYFNGEYYIYLKNGIKLKSGRTYSNQLRTFFNF